MHIRGNCTWIENWCQKEIYPSSYLAMAFLKPLCVCRLLGAPVGMLFQKASHLTRLCVVLWPGWYAVRMLLGKAVL